ncbi:MFS general substrate transporter [Hyaloscypha variabilis]
MASRDIEQGRNVAIVSLAGNSDLMQETGHATQQADHKISKWGAIKRESHQLPLAGGLVVSIPEFRKDYGKPFKGGYVIDAQWQSAFSGGPVASSVIGSLAAGYFGDLIGRRWTITAGLSFTFVGVALEFASDTVQVFFAGKFVNGLALGILTTMVLTWVSEVSPLVLRGLMTGLCNISFCIGPFVAVLIENSVATKTNKWAYRALFVSQWGFGITSVLIAPFMPESSPWWLIGKDRDDDALKQLRQSSGNTYLECFRGTNLRRTIITIMPLTIQAMSGVAYISSYGTYYFQLAGISTARSFQIACGAQALSIAGNIGAFLIIDRVGRRPLVLWAFGFLTLTLYSATVGLTVFYNFAYNFAIGAVAYAVIAETATSRLRAKSIAISSTIQAALFTMWQFVLPYIFNPNEGNLGARTSFIFGGLSTPRRSFEEIDKMFLKHVPARKFKGFKTDAEQMGEDALRRKTEVLHVKVKTE